MTVSYSRLVANGSSFGCFRNIILKWRGSVYKLVWRELLCFLLLYYVVNLTYRFVLTTDQQIVFKKWIAYFAESGAKVPMSFVLGFYVTLVVRRWWEQYRLLPWPDTLALFVSAAIPGVDERGRLMRRNIVRYAVLAYVITLKHVSVRVKKRFPTLQHIVDAGLMMESEKKIFEMLDERHPMAKYWLPLTWAVNIINRARKETLILSDHMVQTILLEMSDIRIRLGGLIGYDNVNIPLVYTQVVTLAVYSYFLIELMAAQPFGLSKRSGLENLDTYFPIILVLEFAFYIGWLKVAEVLIGPFGEDDDDIELNWLIDRHIKAAYMIVDEMHEEHPELLKDQYWDEVVPKDLPYTVASEHYRRSEPKASADFYKVKESDGLYANVVSSRRKSVNPDDTYADYESVDTPMVERRSKNWFHRLRVGSFRSSSTYSSGGLFGRTRHNSVYSSPNNGNAGNAANANNVEAGLPPSGQANGNQISAHAKSEQQKMSLYDRFVGRKSARGQRFGRQVTLKNRPRIPTPDVTKETKENPLDKELRISQMNNNIQFNHSTASALIASNAVTTLPVTSAIVSQPLITTSVHNSTDQLPYVQMLLSPIQELEGNNGTITSVASNSSGFSSLALAKTVLPPALLSSGMPKQALPVAVNVPLTAVSMSQPFFTSIGVDRSESAPNSAVMTDVTASDKDDSACGGSSSGSISGGEERSRKTSVASQSKSKKEVYV
ncbi:unnamed protein product [Bemisia tabaci]|uniref:Bestrophin homolog n=2 Tax=Bemisia tabaci TaxID=7038 RepID=A0A9P0EZI6_BEMTA|nr:PREDICTED: bestrophin-1 isoform X2 [Bemisia tabaci]CAH0385605.1 unnamed protein product [Bemisia tabaci]